MALRWKVALFLVLGFAAAAQAQSGLIPQNQVWAGPASGGPGFARARPLVSGDLPGGGAPTGTAGGDLSGTYPNPTVAKINGAALSGLATGLLKNTTGTGVPSIAAASDVPVVAAGSTGPLSATDPTTTNSRAPTGAAGGGLAGTYPNPTVNVVAAGGTGPLSATDASVTNARAPTGTAGGDLSGTYPNPTVTKINGIDQTTAWTAFTSSPSCGTATFTVNSAKSKTLGKTTHWQFDVTITAIGTCTNTLSITLPNTSNSAGGGAGREIATNGFGVACHVPTGSATLNCTPQQQGITAATVFGVNSRVVASGIYENQ